MGVPELLVGFTAVLLAFSLGAGGAVSGAFKTNSAVLESNDSISIPTRLIDGPNPSPNRMLDQLKLVPREDLASFLATNEKAVEKLLTESIPATEVRNWWRTLDPSQREGLASMSPKLVGNLEGIPYRERDLANRRLLVETIKKLKTKLASGVGRAKVVRSDNQLLMLQAIQKAIKSKPGDQYRSLIALDAKLPGRVVISVGDLSSADYISLLIPGMFFTVEGQVSDWADTAQELSKEENQWLKRLDRTDSQVATVAWIGYQTPHLLNVGSLQLADEGAISLAHSIDGLKAGREGQSPFITVIGHSYGSTAAMIALQDGSIQLSAIAMVGSPGSQAQTAKALGVPGGNVYVGEADLDPVINSAFYGSDPGSRAFGAHRFAVNGGNDPITRLSLSASRGHNEYFQPGSESMRNLALISIGEGSMVIPDSTE